MKIWAIVPIVCVYLCIPATQARTEKSLGLTDPFEEKKYACWNSNTDYEDFGDSCQAIVGRVSEDMCKSIPLQYYASYDEEHRMAPMHLAESGKLPETVYVDSLGMIHVLCNSDGCNNDKSTLKRIIDQHANSLPQGCADQLFEGISHIPLPTKAPHPKPDQVCCYKGSGHTAELGESCEVTFELEDNNCAKAVLSSHSAKSTKKEDGCVRSDGLIKCYCSSNHCNGNLRSAIKAAQTQFQDPTNSNGDCYTAFTSSMQITDGLQLTPTSFNPIKKMMWAETVNTDNKCELPTPAPSTTTTSTSTVPAPNSKIVVPGIGNQNHCSEPFENILRKLEFAEVCKKEDVECIKYSLHTVEELDKQLETLKAIHNDICDRNRFRLVQLALNNWKLSLGAQKQKLVEWKMKILEIQALMSDPVVDRTEPTVVDTTAKLDKILYELRDIAV